MKMLRRRPGVLSQKLRRTLGVHDARATLYSLGLQSMATGSTNCSPALPMCASIYSYAYPNTAQAQLLLHLYDVQISIFYIKTCLTQ